jgi:hypothetical protein
LFLRRQPADLFRNFNRTHAVNLPR